METIKAPFEFVSASFRRTQKQVSREMNELVEDIDSFQEKLKKIDSSSGDNSSSLQSEKSDLYAHWVERISHLLVVLDEASAVEKQQMKKIDTRFKEYHPPQKSSRSNEKSGDPVLSALTERRELALIAEFLLRKGYTEPVEALIAESGEWLEDLLDIDIYKTAAAVESSVLMGDMTLALQWVQDHASKLRRLNSALEFFVRQEQFLNLVYSGKSLEALRFAQTHLAPLVEKPSVLGSENVKTTPSIEKKKDRRSNSVISEDSEDPIQSISSAPPVTAHRSGSNQQRQRAASLGASILSTGGVRRPSYASSRIDSSDGRSTSNIAAYATPPRFSNSISTNSTLPFSLPFSFSANPLAFFQYSHASQGVYLGRERSSSGSFADFLRGEPTFPSASSQAVSSRSDGVIEQEQLMYMKEAMCHLMSMLAFMKDDSNQMVSDDSDMIQALKKSKGRNGTASSSLSNMKDQNQGSSPFGSMVPCLYEEKYTPHRRRCVIDLFRVEFRRVYSIHPLSALERYVQLGVFALKTPSCGVNSNQNDWSKEKQAPPSNSSSSSVINALRFLRDGIRTVRNRARTSSGSSSSSSSSTHSGGDEMEVDLTEEPQPSSTTDYAMSTASSPTESKKIESNHNGSLHSNGDPSQKHLLHFGDGRTKCPVCTPEGQIIAASIPVYAARSESVLVCRGTGKQINHDNPPVALPNGQVYSRSYVMGMAKPLHRTNAFSPSATGESHEQTQNGQNRGSSQLSNDGDSSFLGGCYCGGGKRSFTAGSSPRRSVQYRKDYTKESVGDTSENECNSAKPMSAIEMMVSHREGAGKKCSPIQSCYSGGMDAINNGKAGHTGSDGCGDDKIDAEESTRLFFTCPVTGFTVDVSQLRSVFIV